VLVGLLCRMGAVDAVGVHRRSIGARRGGIDRTAHKTGRNDPTPGLRVDQSTEWAVPADAGGAPCCRMAPTHAYQAGVKTNPASTAAPATIGFFGSRKTRRPR